MKNTFVIFCAHNSSITGVIPVPKKPRKSKKFVEKVITIDNVYEFWASEEMRKSRSNHDPIRGNFHECCVSKVAKSRFLSNKNHIIVLARISKLDPAAKIYAFINDFLTFFTLKYSIMWQLEKYDESFEGSDFTVIHFIMVKRTDFNTSGEVISNPDFDLFADWSVDIQQNIAVLKEEMEMFRCVYAVGHDKFLNEFYFDYLAAPFEFFRFYFVERKHWSDWEDKVNHTYAFPNNRAHIVTPLFGFDQELHRRLYEEGIINPLSD